MSLSQLLGHELDRLRVHEALSVHASQIGVLEDKVFNGQPVSDQTWQSILQEIAQDAGVSSVEILDEIDLARMPLVTWVEHLNWIIIQGADPSGGWIVRSIQGTHIIPLERQTPVMRMVMTPKSVMKISEKPVFLMFKEQFVRYKKVFVEAALATTLINILAIVVSMYSMQVYDRVIPTQGYSTLLVLTAGVFLALFFDLTIKLTRSHLMDVAIVKIDKFLTRNIFGRLMNVRLDKLPPNVGSLSAQIRSYETVRGFLSSTTLYLLVDIPFAVLFLLLIAIIGSPLLALIPLIFLGLSMGLGFVIKETIDEHTAQGGAAANKKTGLLVEAIEGAETIKSGSGGWHFLSKWMDVTDESMHHEVELKRINEKSSHLSGLLHQMSYIGLIGFGAYMASESHLTQGALVACSILSGRALAPISQLPSMVVQAGYAKSALAMLEAVFSLETDNHQIERPIIPHKIEGSYELQGVRFSYQNSPQALEIEKLVIKPGEKIGVIGAVGSGKSTLIRLLSGMYLPSEGRIKMDGVDVEQISRHFLASNIGYLQQDHRLFSGTLRENLLIGIPDPGDEILKRVIERTGLSDVVTNHPRGLNLMIAEGGKGLSGGQRQLVAFSRLLLNHPAVWLLDEPTASMDATTEMRALAVLKEELKAEDTLVLVTHKLNLFPGLVDRLIIVNNHKIILDGSMQEVMDWLSKLTPGQ